jgi:acetylornithine deacetylase
VRLENDPFEARGHELLLRAYSEATEAVIGRAPRETGWGPWADSAITQAAGIPTILCGAAGGRLHAKGEWTSLSELAQLVEILTASAARFFDLSTSHEQRGEP